MLAYINVVDLNEAHLKALEHLDQEGKSEIINLGTENGSSVLEIVKAVQKITGKEFELKKTIPREGEYAKMIAKIEKAKQILDWQPQRSLEDSIESLVKWYGTQPKGWSE